MMPSARERRILLKNGSRIWYLFKITELLFIFFCLLLLCISRFIYHVVDDFTIVYNNTEIENASFLLEGSATSQAMNPETGEREENERSRKNTPCKNNIPQAWHLHTSENISLVDLLIMYPCCCTTLTIFVMEILGHLLQDPINKSSNIVYLCLANGLCICVFTSSIVSSLDDWKFNLICIIAFSGVLQIIIAVNITLLCFT